MQLGRVGVWTSYLGGMPHAAVRPVVAAIEDLGFRAIWYPESVTKEALAQAALLLAAGRHIVVASGIASIWARDPAAMHTGLSPRPSPAASCSASVSAMRRVSPGAATSTAVRWPPCGPISTQWTT